MFAQSALLVGGCLGVPPLQPFRGVKLTQDYGIGEKKVTSLKRLFMLPCALLCASAAIAQVAPTTIFQLDGEVLANTNYPLCTYVVKGSNPTALTSPTACDT